MRQPRSVETNYKQTCDVGNNGCRINVYNVINFYNEVYYINKVVAV